MNVKEEIIGAIDTLVDSSIRKICPVITFGICVMINSKGKCTVKINNKDIQISYYGEAEPKLNQKYPVFVPYNNMSMAFILTSGSSSIGQGLNFEIIGSATAPANPKENTIWVKTSEPITEWSFNANGAALTAINGAIDILYTASTEFVAQNANIIIYDGKQSGILGKFWAKLVGCKQTLNNISSYVNAYIYQNGAWVQFSQDNLVLVQNGVLDSHYTPVNGGAANLAAMTAEGLYLIAPNRTNTYSVGYLSPKIDVTNYRRLAVEWKGHGYTNSVRVGLINTPLPVDGKSPTPQSFVVSEVVQQTGNTYSAVQNTSIDISSLSGEYYFALATAGSGADNYTGEVLASKIIFER